MHQPVHDGVGDGGLTQPLMPGAAGHLAGDECAAAAHPVVQQLEQVLTLLGSGGSDREIVEDKQVQSGQLG